MQLPVAKTRLAVLEFAEVHRQGGYVVHRSKTSGRSLEMDGNVGPYLPARSDGRRGIFVLIAVPGATRFPEPGQIGSTQLNLPVQYRPIEQGFAQDFRLRRSGLDQESRPAEE
jgi:hypothetical protein